MGNANSVWCSGGIKKPAYIAKPMLIEDKASMLLIIISLLSRVPKTKLQHLTKQRMILSSQTSNPLFPHFWTFSALIGSTTPSTRT